MKFKYLRKTDTIQNCIHEEINNRLNSGKAFCRSVQNIMSSSPYLETYVLKYKGL
jgi:hypothetical protein